MIWRTGKKNFSGKILYKLGVYFTREMFNTGRRDDVQGRK